MLREMGHLVEPGHEQHRSRHGILVIVVKQVLHLIMTRRSMAKMEAKVVQVHHHRHHHHHQHHHHRHHASLLVDQTQDKERDDNSQILVILTKLVLGLVLT